MTSSNEGARHRRRYELLCRPSQCLLGSFATTKYPLVAAAATSGRGLIDRQDFGDQSE